MFYFDAVAVLRFLTAAEGDAALGQERRPVPG
jgi:hypothetical protein